MVIMYEMSSLFENMNSFAQSDFLPPQMTDMNHMNHLKFGRAGKFRSHVACRNGLSKSDSQSVTRKKHSKEVEFERKSSQCHIQEQESDRYKIVNLVHQVNASKQTLDNDDVVRHCQETTETKIFIVEQRYGTVPARVAQMFWDQLKRLMGKAAAIKGGGARSRNKFAVAGKGDENDGYSSGVGVGGGGGSGSGSGSPPKMMGLVIDEKPLEEIALNGGNVAEHRMPHDAAALKKKRSFFKKLVTKGKQRLEGPDCRRHEHVFQPIQSVSKIVNDVQTKNRLFELIDANQSGIYQLPPVQPRKSNEPAASSSQPDQNTVKKFFILKFILARKKPSVQTET